jgi:hypothetical protein
MTSNHRPDNTIQSASTGSVLVDSDNPFKLRPYQQEAVDALNEQSRLERALMFAYRYGTVPRQPFRQVNGAPSKAALQAQRSQMFVAQGMGKTIGRAAWMAPVEIDTTPVRTIAGLWEARKMPVYYHVQLAISLWNK